MYNKKVLSTAKAELNKAKAPKKPKDMITDRMGQWKYPGLDTRIPGNGSKDINITMNGVYKPLLAIADTGEKKKLYPGDNHTFRGAKYVDEFPEAKRGGNKKRKTRSLSGTNKLMQKNPLFRDYKNREFDPNVDYFQKGGMNTVKSKDGTVTNTFINAKGDKVIQVKTKDGKYHEKVIPRNQHFDTLGRLQSAINGPLVNRSEPTLEERVDYNLGHPQRKASNMGRHHAEKGEDPIDNIRHPFAGRYTAEALYKMRKKDTPWAPDWMNKGAAWLDANMLGIGHEAGTIFRDERPWSIKAREAAEDIYNNGVGINTGLSDKTSRQKTDYLLNKAYNFELPDGRGEEHPFRNKWVDPYDKKEDGGSINLELTEDEIDQYVKGGYIVEDISVPELNQAQKGKFVAPPLPIDKTRSETTQMVSLPARQAIQHIKNKPGADKAKKKEKKEIQKFKKQLWKEYEKLPLSEKVSDRVGAFFVDPAGMTARALTGEQAYLPGMGKGLLNHEDPEVRDKYLKELGYTKGEFDASDLQNMVNPFYWASSLVDNTEKGNYGTAALEALFMGLPKMPKGTISRSNIRSGAKMLKNDVKNAGEYLTTKTPLKNAYKYNPWAFKPNPKYYYRMGEGRKFIDDVLETNKIRAYNENSYANLRAAGKISGIREDGKIVLKAKTFPEADTYWSKGVPLDGRYASQNYGDHMIEASDDIPFIHAVNQKTKQIGFWDAPNVNYNATHIKGNYVKPRQSYGYNIEGNIQPSIGTPLEYNPELIKLYEPHWLKGYKEVPKQLPGSPNAVNDVQKAGFDVNFLTRPLTLFTKNELLGSPEDRLLYRKIGNAKGLQDLIDKGGAQAPAPMRMTSGATIDTPFFGPGSKPNENYRGLFAVELDPANPKYKWSNYVAGTQNKGVAPYNPETGELVKNIPLEDLNVYKKKWFSNNYKKLKPEELKAALMFAREQALIENAYKWGVRGTAADQIFNDGNYRKAIQNYFLGKPNTSRKKRVEAEDDYEKGGIVADLTPEEIQDYIAQGYTIEELDEPKLNQAQKGGIKTHKSEDGTVTNTITKANGDTVIQVKTKNGKYYEKLIKKSDALDTLSKLQGAVKPEFLALGKAEAETKREEKQAKQKFLKEAWSNYDDWSTVDKASDRVGAFLNDPFGMTARALTGDQAYIPGMAQGLHNHEDPEVRNRYLKELGYTPGEFDASDVQNMINPGYWASSFVENSRKGNIGTAALEGALMFLPHLPKGTVSKSNIKSGAKLLADDIVNKTPLKNTYKILGKDTKFYNPGEKPHWLKGYTESWNPMAADLEPLANFRENQAVKNLQNRDIFKEHDAVNAKFSQILNDLSNEKEIALKANNTKAVSEINAKLDDVFNARLKEHNKIAQKHFQSKEHPFEEQIGAGGFGTVYGLPESEFVIKVGQVPKNESILKLVENSKGINKPNIALPKRASATSSGEKVIVMNKVEPVEGNIFTNPPTKESYEQLIKDVEELQGKGIYLDFENPQNIQYNPKTGLFNIYDLNTTGHILHKTVPKNSYNAGEKTIEQLLIDNKKLPSDWGSIASSKSNAANEWETTTSNLTRPAGEIPYKPEFNTNAASKLYRLTHERKVLFDTPEGEKRIKDLIENTPELKNSGFTVDDYKRGLDDITNVNLHYHRLYKDYADLEKALEYAKNVGGADKQAILDMNTQLGKMSFTLADYEKFIHEPKWYLNAYMNRKGQPPVGLIKPGIHPKDNFDIFANPHLNDLDILRIGRHELGHYIQRGARTNLDDELSKISLLDENPNIKHIPFSESQGSSKLHQLIMSAEDPFKKMKKYWKSAANGREKTPFIEEVRADLLEEGVINNLYDEVTPDMLEYHYINYLKKQGNKYPLRIFDLMENKPENFKIMSDVINKMPAIAPIVGGAGAAAIMGNEQGQKKEMKKGGIVTDLTEKEIREYTARGYIVEEADDEYQDGGEAEAISNIRRRQKEIADLRANSNMSEEVNQTPTQVPVQKTIVINKEPIKPLVRIAVSNKQIEKPKSTVVNKPIVKTFEKSKVKAEQKLNQKQIIHQVQAIKKDLKASYLPNAPKEFYNQFVEKPVTKHVQTPKALHSDNKTYADELKRMMRAIEEDDMMALVSGTEPKPKPLFENSNIEKEILDRQKFDNTHYGRFDTRGDDVMNRTDVKRNRDSELFFANMAKNNSVIVDIGSALGNNNPSMAGVSVWELASNPQIKKKGINVIATDLPDQIKDFKKHVKNKKAYPIDYAEVPETFNTPIADILKSKKLDDKKDVYLRAANSIDLLMNTEQAIEHLNHIAKTLKNKNVTYLYNNVILFKPEGSKTFKKLGNLNNAGFDHNNRTWVKNKNRIPYTLNF